MYVEILQVNNLIWYKCPNMPTSSFNLAVEWQSYAGMSHPEQVEKS